VPYKAHGGQTVTDKQATSKGQAKSLFFRFFYLLSGTYSIRVKKFFAVANGDRAQGRRREAVDGIINNVFNNLI